MAIAFPRLDFRLLATVMACVAGAVAWGGGEDRQAVSREVVVRTSLTDGGNPDRPNESVRQVASREVVLLQAGSDSGSEGGENGSVRELASREVVLLKTGSDSGSEGGANESVRELASREVVLLKTGSDSGSEGGGNESVREIGSREVVVFKSGNDSGGSEPEREELASREVVLRLVPSSEGSGGGDPGAVAEVVTREVVVFATTPDSGGEGGSPGSVREIASREVVLRQAAPESEGGTNDSIRELATREVVVLLTPPPCESMSIAPPIEIVAYSGSARECTIATNGEYCQWVAVSEADWITFTGVFAGTGTGGTVGYRVAENPSLTGRQGVLRAGSSTLVVSQMGAPDCNGNGVGDPADIDGGSEVDCDGNRVPDACDLAAGVDDLDGDGVPDRCQSRDLVIEWTETPPSPIVPNHPIVLTYRVRNLGAGPLRASWIESIRLSGDATVGGDADVLAIARPEAILFAGESIERTAIVTVPVDLVGTRYLVIEVDSSNAVAESGDGESNNASLHPSPVVIDACDATGSFIAACEAVSLDLPVTPGDGAGIEIFNAIGGGPPPTPASIAGRVPDGSMLTPFVDFPRPGAVVNVGQSLATFFASTTSPPEQVASIAASNFTLRIGGLVRIGPELDRDPTTPAIEVSFGVGSDDGYHLTIGSTFLGWAGDRGFTYSWADVAFESPGLYPFTLLFAANAIGQSGLEFSWNTAANGVEIIPQAALYLGSSGCDRKVDFEDLAVGTVVEDQYAPLGLQVRVLGGDIQVTDVRPTEFVPVSGTRVLADPAESPTETGTVEFTFRVPGTDEPATVDRFSLFVIDAEEIGGVVRGFDSFGNEIFNRVVNAGGGTQERVEIDRIGISRVVVSLGSGADSSAIDNICFDRPRLDCYRNELEPDAAEFTHLGGSGTATIETAGASCAWLVEADVPWISFPMGSSGSGATGVVAYAVAANPGVAPRTGRIVAQDATLVVTQAGAPDCNANGIGDPAEIASGAAPDCNANGVPDSCDIADGTASDADGNGVPDSCQYADLVLVAVETVPSSPTATVPFELRWTVRNQGDWPVVGARTDRFLLSADDQIGDDLPLVSAERDDPIVPGAERTFTTMATAPLSAIGVRRLVAALDAFDTIRETAAGNLNNVVLAADPVTFLPPPTADLRVTAALAPVDGVAGQSAPVSWTVDNQGPVAAAGPWTDSVYFSLDETLDPGDLLAATLSSPPTLAAGASYQRATAVNLPAQPGTYRVLVRTDSGGTVLEYDAEANNVRAAPQPVEVRPLPRPDLVVEAIAPPTSGVLSGSTVKISYTVRNVGDAPTIPTWTDLVILSPDTELIGPPFFLDNERILAQAPNPQFLLPGESYANTVAVTLPSDLLGSFHLAVYADARPSGPAGSTFAMSERLEDNNLRFSLPFSIELEPQPDLVVTGVSAPAKLFSGLPLTVGWVTRNQGEGVTDNGQFTHAIYLSPNDTPEISPGDRPLDLTGPAGIAPLQPGQQASFSRSRTVDPSVFGTFFVKVKADAGEVISELGFESNNVGVSPTPVEIILSPAPDLAPTALAATFANPYPGHAFTVTWAADNSQGAPPASPVSWNDAIYLSTDPSFDPAVDVRLGSFGHASGVDEAGAPIIEPYDKSRSLRLPDTLAAGSYHLIVRVDEDNSIFEGTAGGEANNVGATAAPFTVEARYADLRPTSLAASTSSAAAGESLTIDWQVVNAGEVGTPVTVWRDRVYLSLDQEPGPGDWPLGTRLRNAALPAGSSYSASTTVTVPFVPAGAYFVLVVADGESQVLESPGTDGNNVRSIPLTVTGAAADLEVARVDVAPKGSSGDEITVAWTVRNAGDLPTSVGTWQDRAWLSANETFGDADDRPLGARTHTGGLSAGGEYVASRDFAIPISVSGTFHVFVRTDADLAVFEGSEQNNLGMSATPVTVNPTPVANLVASNVAVMGTATSGQPIEVHWTVANAGEGPTNVASWSDSVYLSLDQFLDGSGDIHLGTFLNAGPGLAAGESYAAQRSPTLPLGLSGPYFLIVRTDSGDAVFEAGEEGDNVAAAAFVTLVIFPDPADLVPAIFSPPSGPVTMGETVEFTWAVRNAGVSHVVGQWQDSLYLSRDMDWDLDDPKIGTFTSVAPASDPLAPGEVLMRSVLAAVPGVAPGDYFVLVRTDVFNNVPETIESNNCCGFSMGPVTVGAIPLALSEPDHPEPYEGTLANGQSLFFELDVPAGETVRISLDHASPTAWTEMYVKFGSMPTPGQFDLQSGSPGLPDQEIVIPTTQAGKYYILAKATAGAMPATVTVIAEALPFTIQMVEPTIVGAGKVTLRLTGSMWNETTGFALRSSSSGDFVVPFKVTRVNGSSASATFDLSDASFGTYDVIATSGLDGQSRALPAALQVEAPSALHINAQIFGLLPIRKGTSGAAFAAFSNESNVDVRLAKLRIGSWDTDAGLSVAVNHQSVYKEVVLDDVKSTEILVEDVAAGSQVWIPVAIQVPSSYAPGTMSLFASADALSLDDLVAEFVQPHADLLVYSMAGEANPPMTSNAIDDLRLMFAHEAKVHFAANPLVPEGSIAGFGLCDAICATATSSICVACQGIPPSPYRVLCSLLCPAATSWGCTAWCDDESPSPPPSPPPPPPPPLPPGFCGTSCSPVCPPVQRFDQDGDGCVDEWHVWYRRQTGWCYNHLTGNWEDCFTCDFSLERSEGVGCVPTPQATDPNEKVGPRGFGAERWVSATPTMPYRIYFENLPEATARAARVVIRDDLDASLNPGSVRLGDITIGDVTIDVPDNRINYSTVLDLVDRYGVRVEVLAGVNGATNPPQAFWILQAIDPATGEPPTDAFAGFLPPEDGTGAGQGFVEFTVRPKSNVTTGEVVENSASIVFDVNEPIITNTVRNTIDADPPNSSLSPLPAILTGPEIPLAFAGSDAPGGSGLAGFTLLVSRDGSPLVPFGFTTGGSAVYTAEQGHLYGFATRARDHAGNDETGVVTPTATTVVPSLRLAESSDTGVPGDGITSDRTPGFLLVSVPLSSVAVEVAGPVTVAGQATTGVNGRAIFEVPSGQALPDGTYLVTASGSGVTRIMEVRIDSTGPAVERWESVVQHGAVGDVALAWTGATASEGRGPAPLRVRIHFPASEAEELVALAPEDLKITGVDPEGQPIATDGIDITVTGLPGGRGFELTSNVPLPDRGTYCLELVGVTDRAGNPPRPSDRRRTLAVLRGDATSDRRVDAGDLSTILSLLGTSPIDPTNPVHARCDVDRDGDIDGDPDAPAPGTDFAAMLAAFGVEIHKLDSPCDPVVADGGTGTSNQDPIEVADGAPAALAATDGDADENGESSLSGDATPTEIAAEDELSETFGIGSGFRLAKSMQAIFDPGRRVDLADASRRLDAETPTIEAWPIPGWSIVDFPAGEIPAGFAAEVARSGAFVSPVFLDEAGLPLVPTASAIVRLGDGSRLAAIEIAARGVDPGSTVAPLEQTDRAVVTFSTRFGAEALRRAARLARVPGLEQVEPDFLIGVGLEQPDAFDRLAAPGGRPNRAAFLTDGKIADDLDGLPIVERDATEGLEPRPLDPELASWLRALLGLPPHPMIPAADEILAIRCLAPRDREPMWISRTSWLLRARSLAAAHGTEPAWIPIRIAGDGTPEAANTESAD